MPSLSRHPRSPVLTLALLSALVLAGCAGGSPRRVAYDTEAFDSTSTHTRSYDATEAQTCEAARRALLSQGYMVTAANADLVTGRKNFQPAAEVHVEVEFRVVCAAEGGKGGRPKRTVAFVTALQDRYGLKKVNNSASLGVGAFGSLSLPLAGSDDAMVKVASETLTDERFYDRFFALLDRFLEGQEPGAEEEGLPPEAAPSTSPTSPTSLSPSLSLPVPPAPPAPAPAQPAPATTFPVAPSPSGG